MLYEKITDSEKSIIDDIIDRTVSGDGLSSTRSCSFEHLFRFWETSKTDLFKLLGNNLIINRKIRYEIPLEDLVNKFKDEFYNKPEVSKFTIAFEDWRYSERYTAKYKYVNYGGDTEWREASPANFEFVSRWAAWELAKNKYDGRDMILESPELQKPIKICKGMKIMNILKTISDAFNIEGFEEFRICHSQMLNTKMITGNLCLSIHPIDFFTASENDCGWTSCMNFFNSGEYHLGIMEMMNSPCILEAYITSEKDELRFAGNKTWNSKKWREFYIVDRDFALGIKGYPYWTPVLDEHVLNWIKELAQENWGVNFTSYKDGCVLTDDYCRDNNVYFCTEYMYNDMDCDAQDRVMIYDSTKKSEDIDLSGYNYSGETECLYCGSIDNSFGDAGYLGCCTCLDGCRCESCGELISYDDAIYVNGYYYCQSCVEEMFEYCPISGEYISKHDALYIHIKSSAGYNVITAIDNQRLHRRYFNVTDEEWDRITTEADDNREIYVDSTQLSERGKRVFE